MVTEYPFVFDFKKLTDTVDSSLYSFKWNSLINTLLYKKNDKGESIIT